MRLGDQPQWANVDGSSQLLNYQQLLCRGVVIATFAPQAVPMVKAYAKTIGQPTQNTTSQVLIWVVLHSTPQGRENDWGGSSGQIRWRQHAMGIIEGQKGVHPSPEIPIKNQNRSSSSPRPKEHKWLVSASQVYFINCKRWKIQQKKQ